MYYFLFPSEGFTTSGGFLFTESLHCWVGEVLHSVWLSPQTIHAASDITGRKTSRECSAEKDTRGGKPSQKGERERDREGGGGGKREKDDYDCTETT